MLENISNNSMYTTIPPEVEICFTEEELWDKQNEIFAQNAMIRQKIVGCLIAVISMALWIALTLYDTVQIWWGVELVPLMVIGFYVMLTDKEIHMETK